MTREVREALERLRPVLGAGTETLWASYLAADMNGWRELESQLLLMDMARNRTGPGQGPPPLPPPEPGVLAGWLRLGEVVYPNTPATPFGLNRGELIQHVGIFGRSGAGKTNTVMCLLRELLDKDVPFLIFDWKRNYRDLLAAPWVPEGNPARHRRPGPCPPPAEPASAAARHRSPDVAQEADRDHGPRLLPRRGGHVPPARGDRRLLREGRRLSGLGDLPHFP